MEQQLRHLLQSFFICTFVFVVGCSNLQRALFNPNPDALINSRAVLQRSDLKDFSSRAQQTQDKSCVRVKYFSKSLADKSINVGQELSQCADSIVAIGEFAQPSSPTLLEKPIRITGPLFKADQAKSWCDDLTWITVIDGQPMIQNESCTIVVRYGRMVSSMTVFGNTKTGYWPDLATLQKFTEDRITIFQALGK